MLGQCFCGGIRYQLTPPTDFAGHCHCHSCRSASGAPMLSWTSVPHSQFRLLQGAELVREYARTPEVTWSFCSTCGTTLFYRCQATPSRTYITVASLTTPLDRPLESHVSFEEKPAWFDLSPEVPRTFAKTDVPIEALHEAAEDGDLERVGQLLEMGFPPDLVVDGITPLAAAARGDQLEVCRRLLERGAEAGPGAQQAACRRTPEAARVLELFLDHGVDPQALLPAVVGYSTVAAARLLLQRGADLNQADEEGEFPLYQACSRSTAMVRLLLQQGANPLQLNEDGSHGLHFCACWGYDDRLRALLQGGVPPDLLEEGGLSALSWACGTGQLGCARLLLEAGANPDLASPHHTPLHVAGHYGSPAMVRLLLEHGADPGRRDRQGHTAAQIAGRYSPDLLRVIAEEDEPVRIRRVQTAQGETKVIAHWASGEKSWVDGHAEIAELLARAGS